MPFNQSYVFNVHFYVEDITKTYTHFIEGEKVETERGKWSLVQGTVPKIFPDLPPYLSIPPAKKKEIAMPRPGCCTDLVCKERKDKR